MPGSRRQRILCGAALAATASLAVPGSALARNIWLNWPRVASASSDTCNLDVRGTGQMFVLTVAGLDPSENGQFVIVNGDQKFAWRMLADADGTWKTAYLPYRHDRSSGTILLNVQAPSCFLSASFPWTKNRDWMN